METGGSLGHRNPSLCPGSVRNPTQGHKAESYREGLLVSSSDFCTCVGTPHIQCMWAVELACGPAVSQLGPMFSSWVQPPFKPPNSPMVLLFPPHSLMLLTWCLEIGTRRWMGRASAFPTHWTLRFITDSDYNCEPRGFSLSPSSFFSSLLF